MAKLSIAMIMRDEQEVLARCLESIKGIWDQLVIVDTGSVDNSVEIATSFGAEVHHFIWVNDFAAARNFSFSKCNNDYVFWLDCDDIILSSEKEKILALKPNLNKDMYIFKYDYCRDANGKTMTPDLIRERIVKRVLRWEYKIHECISLQGTMETCDITITHMRTNEGFIKDQNRNVSMLEEIIKIDRRARYVGYLAKEYKDIGQWQKALDLYVEFRTLPQWEMSDGLLKSQQAIELCKSKIGKKLNLGSGGKRYQDYTNCDINPGKDIEEVFSMDAIPYPDKSIMAIHSEHAIEHLNHRQAQKALDEIYRVLVPGGNLHLQIPDLEECCRKFIEVPQHRNWYRWTIYGAQRFPGDNHQTGWTLDEIKTDVEKRGFKLVSIRRYDGYDTPSIELEATK